MDDSKFRPQDVRNSVFEIFGVGTWRGSGRQLMHRDDLLLTIDELSSRSGCAEREVERNRRVADEEIKRLIVQPPLPLRDRPPGLKDVVR